jgi:hypothetical protein
MQNGFIVWSILERVYESGSLAMKSMIFVECGKKDVGVGGNHPFP